MSDEMVLSATTDDGMSTDAEIVDTTAQVPATQAQGGAVATKPKNEIDAAYADSDFEGMGDFQSFLPGCVLNTSGKFEFRNTGEEVDELELTALSGRDVLEHWDEDARAFYKSYDNGLTDQNGDDFTPWKGHEKTKKKYEVEFYHTNEDGEEDLVQIRLSSTAAIQLKQFAAKLYKIHGVKLPDVTIRLIPQRAMNKKLNIKYWTIAVECDEYAVPSGPYSPAMVAKAKKNMEDAEAAAAEAEVQPKKTAKK